ncbi:hypothetical protein EBB06_12615 [Crenobacter cavernae]|uniref:Uncharacterized protein n=1 Tax=Crenobacter cavernae TaxID=2290923 RepID=A0ABY0FAW4_9NEIS|nr:hypothetical protein EBB06_12615 [Crenobacter cavernae]
MKPSRGKTPTHAKKSHTVKKTAKRQVSRTSDVRQAKRPSKAGAYKTKHAGKSAKHVAKMPGKHQIKVKPAKRPVEAKAKRRR